MSDKIARKRAELELLEAEAEFVEKKQSGKLTDEDKHNLRALRRSFREDVREPVKEGAAPQAVGSKAKAN